MTRNIYTFSSQKLSIFVFKVSHEKMRATEVCRTVTDTAQEIGVL